MKLLDLLEGWYDPPEYDDPSGESFVDEDYNDEPFLFNYEGHDKNSGLFVVRHIETGKRYMGHTDYIDSGMYQADTYTEWDQDEDGSYSYEVVDVDNASLTPDSIRLFATVAYNEGDMGIDFDEFETGIAIIEISVILLRGLYENDKKTFSDLTNLLKTISQKKTK